MAPDGFSGAGYGWPAGQIFGFHGPPALVIRKPSIRLKAGPRFDFATVLKGSQLMPAETFSPGAVLRHELQALHQQWWCFLLLGISLIVIGSICIAQPLIATIASVLVLGFLMLAVGITQVVSSFWAGRWSGMLFHLLIGVLYAVVGYMIIDAPGISMAVLTKFIAIFLIVAGVFRIASALVVRFHDWGWVLVNGIVTLILGLVINRQLPEASLWLIGLFVGIEMIFNGWAWVMLSLGLRRVGAAA
jgi:uncharacterized membrane protein HdeD (DUF308 family)